MEGAVRSGYLAAEVILKTLDQPTRLIRPELKPGWLARWLLADRRRSSCRPTATTRSNPPADAANVPPSTYQARIEEIGVR